MAKPAPPGAENKDAALAGAASSTSTEQTEGSTKFWRAVAHHEAGHAVMRVLLFQSYTLVEIYVDPEHPRHVAGLAGSSHGFTTPSDTDPRDAYDSIERHIDALLITFVVLKLTATVAWSWWWVLSPAWIPVAIALVVAAVGLAVGYSTGRRAAAAERADRARRAEARSGRAALPAAERVHRGDLVYVDGTGRLSTTPREREPWPFGVALSDAKHGQVVEVAFNPPSFGPRAGVS